MRFGSIGLRPTVSAPSLVGSCRISRLSAFPEKFTVNKSAKVPWAAIIKDPDHFILAEHQPLSGVAELSKYHAENLRKDWTHWELMQKKGLQGLVFENALKKDLRSPEYIGKGKGKAKAAYIEPSSDEDEALGEDDSSSEDDEMEVEENVDKEEEGKVDGSVEEGDREEDAEGEREDESEVVGETGGCEDQVHEEMAANGAQDEDGKPPTTPPSTPRSSRHGSPEAHPGPAGSHQPEPSELTWLSPHPSPRLRAHPSSEPTSDRGATSSSTPDIDSPVANHSTPDNMVRYLRTLSDEKVYVEFINALLAVEGFNSVCLMPTLICVKLNIHLLVIGKTT